MSNNQLSDDTLIPLESFRLRASESTCLRSRCDSTINRMFPAPGRAGNCCPNDVNMLLAIFNQCRKATLEENPQLLHYTKFEVLDLLIDHPPFRFFDDDSALPDMRRYLTLLAEVLRSFKEDVKALQHDIRDKWYDGINNLDDVVQRARRTCPAEYQIESWDVAFLVKHCQYLIVGIQDSHSKGEKLYESGGQVVKGVLQGYGNQYADAWITAKTLLSRKRKSEDWHRSYIELEQLCFTTSARLDDPKRLEMTPPTDWDETELDAVIALKDSLDDELMKDVGMLSQMLKNTGARIGQALQASGPYEEHAHYFKYGILDLLYCLSFRVTNRKACFAEMVGAIQLVLERSHGAARMLHIKAIDLYYRINDFGNMDHINYGSAEERESIDLWITQHAAEVGSKEAESKYVTRLVVF